jgi:hypothetical protein
MLHAYTNCLQLQEKSTMQRKGMYVAVLSLCLVLAGSGIAAAHDPDAPLSFSNASFVGTYAGISLDPNVGVIGLCNMDGVGAFNCNFTINAPGENDDRIVDQASSSGTYTMTAVGIGFAPEEQTYSDGSTSDVVNLFTVTGASVVGHNLLATEIDSSVPDGNGGTSHSVLKRLPDMGNVQEGFSNASIDGIYALTSPFGAGIASVCAMDGAGNFACSLTAAVPDENGGSQFVTITNSGEYTVTSDGMGSVHYANTLPDGTTQEGDDDFVISAAETEGPFAIATELTDLGRAAGDNGSLNVSILHRLPDVSPTETMTDTTSAQ